MHKRKKSTSTHKIKQQRLGGREHLSFYKPRAKFSALTVLWMTQQPGVSSMRADGSSRDQPAGSWLRFSAHPPVSLISYRVAAWGRLKTLKENWAVEEENTRIFVAGGTARGVPRKELQLLSLQFLQHAPLPNKAGSRFDKEKEVKNTTPGSAAVTNVTIHTDTISRAIFTASLTPAINFGSAAGQLNLQQAPHGATCPCTALRTLAVLPNETPSGPRILVINATFEHELIILRFYSFLIAASQLWFSYLTLYSHSLALSSLLLVLKLEENCLE